MHFECQVVHVCKQICRRIESKASRAQNANCSKSFFGGKIFQVLLTAKSGETRGSWTALCYYD